MAQSCLEAWGGCATVLANEGVARSCIKARGGRAVFLAGLHGFVGGSALKGFGWGLCLGCFVGFFAEQSGIFVIRNQV